MESYQKLVNDPPAYRQWLDKLIIDYPALFPRTIREGYTLHDRRSSEKMQGIELRRIKLKPGMKKDKSKCSRSHRVGCCRT
jgi:hypothetical protein